MALPCSRWASAQSPSPSQQVQLHGACAHHQQTQTQSHKVHHHRMHLSPPLSGSPLPPSSSAPLPLPTNSPLSLSANSSLWGTPLAYRSSAPHSYSPVLAPSPSASASPSSHGPSPALAPKPMSRKRSPLASSACKSAPVSLSLSQTVTVLLCHCIAVSVCHTVTAALCHCVHVCLTVPQAHEAGGKAPFMVLFSVTGNNSVYSTHSLCTAH